MLLELASTSGSLADPPGSSAVVAAVAWVEGTLLGTVATTVAIIAIASVGFMLLTGRVSLRHGLTVIVGSFILFGAPTIASGIRSSLAGADIGAAAYAPAPRPVMAEPRALPPPIVNDDPYAGASVARP